MIKKIIIRGLRFGQGKYTVKHGGYKDSIFMNIPNPEKPQEVEVYFKSGKKGEPFLLKTFSDIEGIEGIGEVDAYMHERADDHAHLKQNEYADLSGVRGPKVIDKSRRGKPKRQSALEDKTTMVHTRPKF